MFHSSLFDVFTYHILWASITLFTIAFWLAFSTLEDITDYQKMKVLYLLHRNCRNRIYPLSKIERTPVPDQLVLWTTEFKDYQPKKYESPTLEGKPWADPKKDAVSYREIKWNQLDGAVNRASFVGKYQIENGVPLNPFGRTGISERGLLGRWGPNHEVHPIVTKWKRDSNSKIEVAKETGRPILQMIAIPKRDNRIWAIAGGVPDGTDKISSALKRELIAETRSRSINMSMAERITYAFMIGSVFIDDLTEIYSGYVDDPRNTDNSWVETTVCNYHDDSANTFETLTLQAGSDAKRFQWLDIDGNLNFYSNHKLFVKRAVDLLKAHW